MPDDDRTELRKRMAKMVAWREKLQETRKSVNARAAQQLDANAEAVEVANQHVSRGKAGVLGQRYLKTRLVENARLRPHAAQHEAPDVE